LGAGSRHCRKNEKKEAADRGTLKRIKENDAGFKKLRQEEGEAHGKGIQ